MNPLTSAVSVVRMQALRARQPFSANHLRPCMIIDHPEILREAVRRFGARATYPGGGPFWV